MRWGQVILDNTLYKWRTRYISYKALKRLIRSLSEEKASSQNEPIITMLDDKFSTIVATDLSKVESFYNFQMTKLGRQYEVLMKEWKKNNGAFRSHITYGLLTGMSALRTQLKELKHYAFINAEGFRKIIKKYDKRLRTKTLGSYLVTFNKCNFYKQSALNLMIRGIEHIVDNSGTNFSSKKSAVNALIRAADRESDLESVANINTRNLSTLVESAQNEKISQLFTNAVRANKFEAVECIVEYFNNADDAANNNDNDHLPFLINARGYLGNTSLMTCCAVLGSMKIARLLLKHGADISLQNSYCRTVLHIASQRGHLEMLRLLLSVMEQRGQKGLIHELDKDMHSALHLGCLRKQYAASHLLMEADPTVVNQQNADGATPLMIACSDRSANHQDKAEVIGCILKHCANMNQRDWKMQSALHYACISGDQSVVELLLKHEINPFVFDSNGMSPLHIAADQGELAMVTTICEYCIAHRSGTTWSLGDDPCTEWKSTIPIVDHTDNRGRTPLHLAAGKGHSEITKYLIDIGASTTMLDDNGCNAHSYACYNGLWTDQCSLHLMQMRPLHAAEEHKSSGYDGDHGHESHDSMAMAAHRKEVVDTLPSQKSSSSPPVALSNVVSFMESKSPDPPSSSTHSAVHSSEQMMMELERKMKMKMNMRMNGRGTGGSGLSVIPSTAVVDGTHCVVKFRIQCDTSSAQYLCILGDTEELGQWDVTRAVRMYENKMPSRHVSTDEETDYTDTEQQREMDKKQEDDDEEGKMKTWICEVALPRGTSIQYRYIVRVQSSLQSWESLPTERSALVHESMIIDDGVFGQSPSLINRHSSYPHNLSELATMDANAENYSEMGKLNFSPSPGPTLSPSPKDVNKGATATVSSRNSKGGSKGRSRSRSGHGQREQLRRYIQSGYLASDAQLQIRLGHVTLPQKKPPLIINNNLHIDRIVIRSGYINTNRYRGIHVNVAMPISDDDRLKVYKFQARHQQINSLCSLEFEFYPRSGPAIARVFVLPSQILSNDMGSFTLALLSTSNDQRGGLLIGEFNFEYTLIRPFTHKSCGNILRKTFQHKSEYNKTILIGHRGTGGHGSVTLPGPRRTHIQENTILAFNTAQSFGADFVEFDVQLTKDNVPIIYHDFLFRANGFNIPINKITFEEMQKYNLNKLKHRSPGISPQKKVRSAASKKKARSEARPEALSAASKTEESLSAASPSSSGCESSSPMPPKGGHDSNGHHKAATPPVFKRVGSQGMKHSHSFANMKQRQNLGVEEFHTFLDDNICTLSDVFKLAPVNLGLNIEIKYPMFEEREQDGVENVVDINEYVDRILECVFDHDSSQRYIIFSSFHPDICKLVQLKQPQFPVLFLTEGGKTTYCDERCNSLQNAVQMARSCSLFGVVTDVSAVLQAPHLIDVVHENGLILLTYGDANNDSTMIDLQTEFGIDGLISDHVQYVRAHLDSAKNATLPAMPPPEF